MLTSRYYTKTFLTILLFFVQIAMSMDNTISSNAQRIISERIMQYYIVWDYQSLVNASLVNKDWYNSIRIKNIGATQRKEFLKQQIKKTFQNATIYFDGFVFHPSGCIAGCLRSKWGTCLLCSIRLTSNVEGKTWISFTEKELECTYNTYVYKFSKENWSFTMWDKGDYSSYTIISKPFFVKDSLGTEVSTGSVAKEVDVVKIWL